MEKTLQIHAHQYEPTYETTKAITCDECKSQFETPIIATLTCQTGTQKYYACPHCLAQVREVHQVQTQRQERSAMRLREMHMNSVQTVASKAKQTGCAHGIGYLRTRPKNTPIPDECLTCNNMVDCMLH